MATKMVDTRCLYWVSRQPSPRSNYSPSPPMKLMTSQSLPPSSASSVMIMGHSIDLAGLAHRKNSLTLHCFLTWNSNQSDKISPPYPPGFGRNQVSHTPTDRSGPELSADIARWQAPGNFFLATLAWTRAMPMFKRKLGRHLLAKSQNKNQVASFKILGAMATKMVTTWRVDTRCLYWVSRQPSPRSNYSPSPPMKLMTSQSLPPSSASSVMIMGHSIDLAGLAHRKNSLTLHCFLTWNSNQSDKISPPYPPGFGRNQVSQTPTDRSGPGLSADIARWQAPGNFFLARLAWTRAMPMFKWKLGRHLLAKSHI